MNVSLEATPKSPWFTSLNKHLEILLSVHYHLIWNFFKNFPCCLYEGFNCLTLPILCHVFSNMQHTYLAVLSTTQSHHDPGNINLKRHLFNPNMGCMPSHVGWKKYHLFHLESFIWEFPALLRWKETSLLHNLCPWWRRWHPSLLGQDTFQFFQVQNLNSFVHETEDFINGGCVFQIGEEFSRWQNHHIPILDF